MPTPVTLQPKIPVDTTTPTLQVTGMQKAGQYTFQLVVTDDFNLSSKPVTFVIAITATAIG